jgi:hypothetical protein
MERSVPTIGVPIDTVAVLTSGYSSSHAAMECGGAVSETNIPTYTRRQLCQSQL